MRFNLLAFVSGSLLIAGGLVGAFPSHAQDVCFFVDSSGQTISLNHLCQGSGASEAGQGQSESSPSSSASSRVAEPSTENRSTRRVRRRRTATRASSASGRSARRAQSETGAISNPSSVEVRRRRTRIQTLETPNGTVTVIDRPDRTVGGITIRGRDEVIITKPNPQPTATPNSVSPNSTSVHINNTPHSPTSVIPSTGSIRINVSH